MSILKKNRDILCVLVAASTLITLAACGGKKPDPRPEWVFKQKSIEVSYESDQMLNEFKGTSHVLQLVIYQLNNINKFKELAENKDGLIQLLKGQNFDPSVTAVKKLFIDPGKSEKLVLDRAEESCWIAFAAGFFDLKPGRATCFFQIPYNIEKQGFIFKDKVAVIPDMRIKLILGPGDIKGIIPDE